MGWLLLIAAICVSVPTSLFMALIGQMAEKGDAKGIKSALVMSAVLLVTLMALLLAAGFQFGGSQ